VAPRKLPRQARSRALVEAVLDAAARVLVRRGYAGTTTNHVAEKAGISVGSLYQYFPNKDALVAALHARHAREIVSVLDDGLGAARAQSLDATIRALVAAVVRAHLVDPALHRVLEGEAASLDRFDGVAELDRAMAAKVRAILAAHRDEIAPRNLELAAFVVMRVVDGLVHAAVIDPPRLVPAKEIEAEIVRVVLGYLLAGEGRA
jgi:AcrR family transcriptional regulator